MSIQINDNDLSVEVLRQSQYNARSAAGTLKEGNPYDIADVKAPEIYGGGVVQTTAPTTDTVGAPGDVYIAVISNAFRIWDCVAANGSAYTWKERLRDARVNGTSRVADGVFNVPLASTSVPGVIKMNSNVATQESAECLIAQDKTYAEYSSGPVSMFVGKGTLENVLDNESVRPDKATSLTSSAQAQARENISAQAQITASADWDTLTTL